MEGSYNKVWSTRNTVQGEEFMFFYDILIETIRLDMENFYLLADTDDYFQRRDCKLQRESIRLFAFTRCWHFAFLKEHKGAARFLPKGGMISFSL